MISVESLSKQFPRETRPAVDAVSFEVEAGELMVLLGPSGCGKTTLLKMINRLYEPSAGQILIEGVEVRSLPKTALRRRIGYAIQQTGLFPHLRIEQNIAVVPQLLGWPRERIEPRVDELLDLVGLPREFRRRYPRQLSGGQQQRVGLARALAADPAIMLMDEPFGALDAITRTRLQDELMAIQHQLHKTILFVTHDIEEALRLADRVLIMNEGRLVQLASPLEILAKPADAFVAELTGAEDLLRRLSLIAVETALAKAPVGGANPVGAAPLHPRDDLRTALTRLLVAGEAGLPVVADEQMLGQLTMGHVRAALRVGV